MARAPGGSFEPGGFFPTSPGARAIAPLYLTNARHHRFHGIVPRIRI
jgi:hypothetical protein